MKDCPVDYWNLNRAAGAAAKISFLVPILTITHT